MEYVLKFRAPSAQMLYFPLNVYNLHIFFGNNLKNFPVLFEKHQNYWHIRTKIGLETGTFLWIPYIANEYNEMDISHENRPWLMGPIAYRIGPNRIGPILSIIEAICKCKLHVHCTLYVTYFSGYSDSILLGIRCPGSDPLPPKNFTPSFIYSL